MLAYRYSRDKIEQILPQGALCTHNPVRHPTRCSTTWPACAGRGTCRTIISLIRVFGHKSDPQNLIGYMADCTPEHFLRRGSGNVCFVPSPTSSGNLWTRRVADRISSRRGSWISFDQENRRGDRYSWRRSPRPWGCESVPDRPKLVLLRPMNRPINEPMKTLITPPR